MAFFEFEGGLITRITDFWIKGSGSSSVVLAVAGSGWLVPLVLRLRWLSTFHRWECR
jgi:hypothetical protein